MGFKKHKTRAAWRNALCFCSLAILLCISCDSKKDEAVEKLKNFQNGEISRRYYEVKGKKEGKMTDYYPGGKIESERLFKNDLQAGRTVLYHPGGQVKEVQYYENGTREGGDTIWYEDGSLKFTATFREGKLHGYLRKWQADGTLNFEAKYEMDSLVEVKGESVRRNQDFK